MKLHELLSRRRSPGDHCQDMLVTRADLEAFGSSVERIHDDEIFERSDPECAITKIVLASWNMDDGEQWYRIDGWTSTYDGFEWRHLYFGEDGYLYYPHGPSLIAFIRRAMSHVPGAKP